MAWKSQPEERVSFGRRELEQYRALIEALRRNKEAPLGVRSAFPPWPHLVGRGQYGEFPLMVVARHYRKNKYTVWFCEPALENYESSDFVGFMLLSYPGRRAKPHKAYERMQEKFGAAMVERLNRRADAAKQAMNHGTGNRGGGDPDLFVFKGRERFFVEVKWKDQLKAKQCVTFPLIEHYCNVPVKIVRIFERGPTATRQSVPPCSEGSR